MRTLRAGTERMPAQRPISSPAATSRPSQEHQYAAHLHGARRERQVRSRARSGHRAGDKPGAWWLHCGGSDAEPETDFDTSDEPHAGHGDRSRPRSFCTAWSTSLPDVPFTIDASARAAGTDRVRVTGTTNLPAGSVIEIAASRALRNGGETDLRESPAGKATVTLDGDSFSMTLAIDESTLPLGVDEQFPIAVVSNQLDICVVFATGVDQDGQPRQPAAAVREMVGPSGERLANSPRVDVFGSATEHPAKWLEVQTTVRLPPLVLDQITTQQGRSPKTQALDGFCLY